MYIYIYIYIYIYTHIRDPISSQTFENSLCYCYTSYEMISGSKEQLQQQMEYTLQNLIVIAGEFQKCNLDVRTL